MVTVPILMSVKKIGKGTLSAIKTEYIFTAQNTRKLNLMFPTLMELQLCDVQNVKRILKLTISMKLSGNA